MSDDVFHLTDIQGEHTRIRWVPETDDLHMNVVHLRPGEDIGAHVNQALDVVVTCLQGAGEVTVDESTYAVEPGSIVLVRRGANRHIQAGPDGMVYTTVHRKRGGIMPTAGVQ